MDEFLTDIHISIFKRWICNQTCDGCEIYMGDNRTIYLLSQNCHSTILFYPMGIIELSVTNSASNEIEFYLHFQFKTMKHAIDLFNEMMETIKHLMMKPTLRVLLCCSGGLTTGYFANKVKDVVQLLNLDIEIEATGYNNLYHVGENYDMILLAPQVSYLNAKAKEILKKQIVLNIPSSTFAKYNVKDFITFIEDHKNEKKMNLSQIHAPLKVQNIAHTQKKILCFSLIRNSNRIHIIYRLYDEQNRILIDNEIIKPTITLQDYYDVIDSMIVQYPDIKTIGLSTPGIIKDGIISSMALGLNDLNVYEDFESKYSQKFVFVNDVNALALGYHNAHPEYQNVSLIFQPVVSFGGVGSIVNNQLIQGEHHIAGEVQYLSYTKEKDVPLMHHTLEGALESLGKSISAICSILDPECIVICCFLITNTEEVIKEVEKYIPKRYIPKIKRIDYLPEYSLVGTLIASLEK